MKNLKSFNEMRNSNIHTGIELTPKQINYIFDGIDDKKYLKDFEILVDDGIFYVKYEYYNEFLEFNRIQDLRDFIHLTYYLFSTKYDHSNKILEIVKRNKNLDYSSLIVWASVNGHAELVKLLLQDDRVDPSANDNLSIILTIQERHTEIVNLLLQDPSVWDNYAIRWANANKHTQIVKLLIQHSKVRASLTEKEIEEYEKS